MGKLKDTPIERIERLVPHRPDDGCWISTLTPRDDGYVTTTYRGKHGLLHRFAYAAYVGEPGPTLDHLCRNRACCNPKHLESVTNKVNISRGIAPTADNARKEECLRGHPFDDTNTYNLPRRDGSVSRVCRRCAANASTRYYYEKRRGRQQEGTKSKYPNWVKGETCRQGHAYAEHGYLRKDGRGYLCRVCAAAKRRKTQ